MPFVSKQAPCSVEEMSGAWSAASPVVGFHVDASSVLQLDEGGTADWFVTRHASLIVPDCLAPHLQSRLRQVRRPAPAYQSFSTGKYSGLA